MCNLLTLWTCLCSRPPGVSCWAPPSAAVWRRRSGVSVLLFCISQEVGSFFKFNFILQLTGSGVLYNMSFVFQSWRRRGRWPSGGGRRRRWVHHEGFCVNNNNNNMMVLLFTSPTGHHIRKRVDELQERKRAEGLTSLICEHEPVGWHHEQQQQQYEQQQHERHFFKQFEM